MTVTHITDDGRDLIYTPDGWTFEGKVVKSSHMRGHAFEVDEACYFKDGTPWDERRPCKRCGCAPTPEGHDACLGQLPSVRSACCGHGVEPGYIVYGDGHVEQEEAD